jgi:hypothetical protein
MNSKKKLIKNYLRNKLSRVGAAAAYADPQQLMLMPQQPMLMPQQPMLMPQQLMLMPQQLMLAQ